MKTHYSDVTYATRMAELHARRLQLNPPAVPFERKTMWKKKKKKKKKSEESDDDSDSDFKRLYLYHDPEDPDNSRTYEYKVRIFEDGTPEDFIRWYTTFEEEIVPNMPADTAAKKSQLIRQRIGHIMLVEGAALDSVTKIFLISYHSSTQ